MVVVIKAKPADLEHLQGLKDDKQSTGAKKRTKKASKATDDKASETSE